MTLKQKIYRIIGILLFGYFGIATLGGAIGIQQLSVNPDNSQGKLIMNIMSIVAFALASGSFYLVRKFWKQLQNG